MHHIYHISEERGIREFIPRPISNNNCGIQGDAVWAIDKEHLVNYLLPRDCPRVTFFIQHQTTEEDRRRFFSSSYASRIIAIESGWLDQIATTNLIQYEFESSQFKCIDSCAGYFISREIVRPIGEYEITDLLKVISEMNTEIRITPMLWKIREEVINSSLGYSIIRMRNAKQPPEGISMFHPLP
jgi:hypothetical protein